MPHLLHLDSSSSGSSSVSREITAAFADAWQAAGEGHTVTYRDLNSDPLPHLPDSELHFAPRLRSAGAHPPDEAEALQQELIDELSAADVLLVGAPLYNYTLPSTLKTWIDYVHVLGTTTPFDGPTQPVKGRPAVVVTSQGAFYGEGAPTPDGDHLTPVLQLILGTALGMDVTVLTASCTLAGRIAPMKALQPRAAAERAAAIAAAGQLAADLG